MHATLSRPPGRRDGSPLATASSPQLIRRLNAESVVRLALGTGPFNANDLIAATGLTRATVLSVCDQLVSGGLIDEVENARQAGQYERGRPARRYQMRAGAGHIVGVDAGEHRITCEVTDLTGQVLGRGSAAAGPDRLGIVRGLIDETLAPVANCHPVVTVVGVPAPVDAAGDSPSQQEFWRQMNPHFASELTDLGHVVVDNDANLAALAERSSGAASGARSFAVLLSGERFGAGLVVDGNLLHGDRGGAGEFDFLKALPGLENPDGLGRLARNWAQSAARDGQFAPDSPLAAMPVERIAAEDVFAAAGAGEPVATSIMDRLAARLAGISDILVGLLGLEQVIIAGAIAGAAGPVVERASTMMTARSTSPQAVLSTSRLGGDVVLAGAIEQALSTVRSHPLELLAEHWS